MINFAGRYDVIIVRPILIAYVALL